jgi:hypothetical protein
MNYKILYLIILLLLQHLAIAQSAKFKWEDGVCNYEGDYNSSKYSLKQINDTYKLWIGAGGGNRAVSLDVGEKLELSLLELDSKMTSGVEFKLLMEQLKAINLNDLDQEYKEQLALLINMKVINTRYWQDLRKRKIVALQQYYKIRRSFLVAYQNPEVLRQYSDNDQTLNKYLSALKVGGQQLLDVWKEVNIERRKRNCCPERMEAIFEYHYALPENQSYAQFYVMTFGVWNHVASNSKLILSVEYTGADLNFRKLFTNVREFDCAFP